MPTDIGVWTSIANNVAVNISKFTSLDGIMHIPNYTKRDSAFPTKKADCCN